MTILSKFSPCFIFRLFQRLTLDTIADCGFGMDTNALINKNDECIKHCRGVIRDTTKRPILFMLGCTYLNHIIWLPTLVMNKNMINSKTKRCKNSYIFFFYISVMFPALHRFWIFIYNVMRFISFNPVFWLEDSMRKIVRKQKQQKVYFFIFRSFQLHYFFKKN